MAVREVAVALVAVAFSPPPNLPLKGNFAVDAVAETMLIMFPLALGLAATAKPVITLFAGQQYEAGWPILATLALFGLVYGFSPAFSNILLIYGKTKTILLVNLRSVALSLTMLPTLQFLGLGLRARTSETLHVNMQPNFCWTPSRLKSAS
jgi:hypothetical protein